MVAAAKSAVPTVGDQAAALQLENFAKQTASALAELHTVSAKVVIVTSSHDYFFVCRLLKCVVI